ncbi:MAG TPA: alanine--glyoxylate aminotransferase family protein [Anaerolineaceae bacterium]|nr:alanine--glyoxylate aminotransferase family protein [Anaerolineaceae bacterium]
MSHMFVPGPVDVAPEVLAAQAKPMLPHRSKEFEEIFRRTEEKAKKVFYTEGMVFQVSGSGTALQEAGIRNFVQESVLCCVNGAFAQRWFEVAKTNGKQADALEVEWGKPVSQEQLADALKQKHYEAVTIVHNETSTGVENPVKDLAAVVREVSPDTLVLVDAVSSLSGVKIEMDAWGLDWLLTSSQKCLALPPGLALGSPSARAMQKAESVENRGWYLDLVRTNKHRIKDSTAATPVMPLIYALDVQLDRILAEGLENRFARHAAMADCVQKWATDRGMSPFGQEGFRSKTVVTINNSRNIPISDLNKFLLQRGMRISNGYGQLKEKTFRIATMGETTPEDVQTLLEAMDEFLAKL